MNDDAALLRSYAEEGSESAFTTLVQRHVDLVYAAALRRVGGDAHLAADIAQQVFTTLARQAGRLSHVNVLGAWLHTATRNAATDLVIAEQRRKAREQAALDPALAPDAPAPEWERLKPMLDAAIDELPAPDREAIVLRFLERRAFGEIGMALKVSTDAARMRTERALDKLRAALAKRGITSTAAAVGALMSSQPLISAPAGLGTAIAASSLTTAGAGAGALAAGMAAIFMNFKTVGMGVAVLAAFLGGTYVGLTQQLDAPPLPAPEAPRHSQTIADLRKENLALRTEVAQLRAANARLTPPPAAARVVAAPASQPAPEIMSVGERQRAMLNNLRQLEAARDQFVLENGRTPTVQELVGPDKYVRFITAADGEDYSNVGMGADQLMTVVSPNGISVTFDRTGKQTTKIGPTETQMRLREYEQRLKGPLEAAMQAYQAANPGAQRLNTESGLKALLPYLPTPQLAADLIEVIELVKQEGGLPP